MPNWPRSAPDPARAAAFMRGPAVRRSARRGAAPAHGRATDRVAAPAAAAALLGRVQPRAGRARPRICWSARCLGKPRARARKGVASGYLAERRRAGQAPEASMSSRTSISACRRSPPAGHHDRPGHRRRPLPRLHAGTRSDGRHGQELAVLRRAQLHARLPLSARMAGLGRRAACSRASTSPSRATSGTRCTCSTGCGTRGASCSRGWKRAPRSTCAATRRRWRRTCRTR